MNDSGAVSKIFTQLPKIVATTLRYAPKARLKLIGGLHKVCTLFARHPLMSSLRTLRAGSRAQATSARKLAPSQPTPQVLEFAKSFNVAPRPPRHQLAGRGAASSKCNHYSAFIEDVCADTIPPIIFKRAIRRLPSAAARDHYARKCVLQHRLCSTRSMRAKGVRAARACVLAVFLYLQS